MIELGVNSIRPVANVLQSTFPNLTPLEIIELAIDIVTAINVQLKNEK